MNSRLVLKDNLVPVDIGYVKKFVIGNKREWVTISGGEPTLNEFLPNLIDELKSWGCKVGMSTNGTNNKALENVLGKLNYVALDIKTSIRKAELVYPNVLWSQTFKSYNSITQEWARRSECKSDFNFEVRTTLYPLFVDKEDIVSIAGGLNYGHKWVLQQFRLAKNRLENNDIQPYSEEQVDELLKIAQKYIPTTSLGYV